MKERRQHIRFSISQAIEVTFSRETYVYMEGVNLSESGMLCRSSESVETGGRLYLMFSVPVKDEEVIIRCEGIVMRCLPDDGMFRIGILFTGLPEEDRKKIEEYSREVLGTRKDGAGH